MEVILARPEVAAAIRGAGGKLFVRTDPHRCCGGGLTYLMTSAEAERGHEYQRFEADGFELYLDAGNRQLPDELVLDLKGLKRKRVEAFWNGCAFAI